MFKKLRHNPELYALYRLEEGCCELALYARVEFRRVREKIPDALIRGGRGMFLRYENLIVDAADVHHIWGGKTRYDYTSNLIAIAREPHDLFHSVGGWQAELRMLCMYAKARKAEIHGDWRQFDLEELDFCAGLSVAGWTECQSFKDEYLVRCQKHLLKIMEVAREKRGAVEIEEEPMLSNRKLAPNAPRKGVRRRKDGTLRSAEPADPRPAQCDRHPGLGAGADFGRADDDQLQRLGPREKDSGRAPGEAVAGRRWKAGDPRVESPRAGEGVDLPRATGGYDIRRADRV